MERVKSDGVLFHSSGRCFMHCMAIAVTVSVLPDPD